MPIDPAYRTPHGLTDQIRERLSSQGNAVLATINQDGSPHLTELLFDLDDRDRILLPTPHNTRKVLNLKANSVATVFFFDQPGWTSCTGHAEIIEGEEAAAMNQRNRDRLLTESGHQTIGRLLAAHEDVTIVVTPTKWLSWSSSKLIPGIIELGGDVETNPPETWFRDLP
jgi:hypothetical protein